MAAMAAAMRTELHEHRNRVHEALQFTIAGTTFNYASTKGGVIRNDAGLFKPGMISRSTIPRKLSWPSYGLADPRVTFRIYDENRDLQKHLGGPGQGQAKGSALEHWWRSENVTSANHYQLLNAVIKDVRIPSERVYEIVAGVNDAPLRDTLNIPILSRPIWPNIPVENEDLPGSVYLGNWLSTGILGAAGMVPATLVDDVNGIWVVSYGFMDAVTNIQEVGVGSVTDFTVLGARGSDPYLAGGRPYTVLRDDAGTKRTIGDTILCDVAGPETRGDGSGSTAVLVKPAAMLRIALANFCYNDWPVGAPTPGAGRWAWFSETAEDANTPIDADSNDDADDNFFDPHQATASMLLQSDDTGLGVIKTWAQSFRCPVGWDTPFELVTRPIKLNNRSPYATETITRFLRDIRKVQGKTRGSDAVTAHKTTYIFNSADGAFMRQRSDGNRFCVERVEKPFEFTYGPAESV